MAAERLDARVPGRERVPWSGEGGVGVGGAGVVGGGGGGAAATAFADGGGGEEVASERMAAS